MLMGQRANVEPSEATPENGFVEPFAGNYTEPLANAPRRILAE
jgi:hypothetical protein